jgi:hypothetical protein
MNFEETWLELETLAPTGSAGRFKRRIHPDSTLDIFVGVAKPSNQRLLMLLVSDQSLMGVEALLSAEGLESRIVRPGEDGRDATLELALVDPRYTDIFAALAEDIVRAIVRSADEVVAVREFVTRLQRWQRFLEEAGLRGLSEERQRGLYAELWVMRDIMADIAPSLVLSSWTGPEYAGHDFQFGSCALEVKASAAKQHQVLHIASERQLDDTGVGALFLSHVSLDAHRHSGETLPQLVDELMLRLAEAGLTSAFESKLIEDGYLERQRSLYDDVGYTIREYNLFRVSEGFPRIIESDLRQGVGDVRYTITVAECMHFCCDRAPLVRATRG